MTGLIANGVATGPIGVPEQLSAEYSLTVTEAASGVVSGKVTGLTYSVAAPAELWFPVLAHVAAPPPIVHEVEYQRSPDASVAVTFRATTLPGAADCGDPATASPGLLRIDQTDRDSARGRGGACSLRGRPDERVKAREQSHGAHKGPARKLSTR